MPLEKLIAAPVENRAVATSAANGVATATQAVPGSGKRLVATGFSYSADRTLGSIVTLQIRRNGGATEIRKFVIPAAAIAPVIVEFKHVHRGGDNQDMDITASAGGAGVIQVVELLTLTEEIA